MRSFHFSKIPPLTALSIPLLFSGPVLASEPAAVSPATVEELMDALARDVTWGAWAAPGR